jgi:hypothetical protein
MREWLILIGLLPFNLTAQIYAGGSGDGYAYQETAVSFTGVVASVVKQDTFIARDTTFNGQFPVFYEVPENLNWHLSDMNGRIIQMGYGNISFMPRSIPSGTYVILFWNEKTVQSAKWTFINL